MTEMIAPKKPTATVEKPAREPMAARTLWFVKPTDLPGKNSADALMCKDSPGARWTAAFLPWLRSFEVSYFAPGSKDAVRRMVGEHMVASWEPLA